MKMTYPQVQAAAGLAMRAPDKMIAIDHDADGDGEEVRVAVRPSEKDNAKAIRNGWIFYRLGAEGTAYMEVKR